MGVVEVSDPGSLQSDSERQLGGNDCQGGPGHPVSSLKPGRQTFDSWLTQNKARMPLR